MNELYALAENIYNAVPFLIEVTCIINNYSLNYKLQDADHSTI